MLVYQQLRHGYAIVVPKIAGLHQQSAIDADYLNYEKPTAYDDYPALANVACLVDGKDMVSDTIRANSHASRHQWSSK